MKFLFAIIALVYTHQAFSQTDFREAYLVINEGDTLTGVIDFREGRKNYKTCEFRKTRESESTIYSPYQIQSYRFANDKYFETIKIINNDGTPDLVFMEVLIKGNISLYKYINRYFIAKDKLLYELINEKVEVKVSDGLYAVKTITKDSKEYLGILLSLLSDCEESNNVIKNTRLIEKDLIKIVKAYNDCKGAQSTIYKTSKPWLRIKPGVQVSYASSSIQFSKSANAGNDYITGGFDKSDIYSFGADMVFVSPRLNERTALYIGLFYLKPTYVSFTEYQRQLYIEQNDVSIQFEQLKIPIGFRYSLAQRHFGAPFLNFGASAHINLNLTSSWTQTIISNNNIVETPIDISNNMEIKGPMVGFWAGIGWAKEIHNNHSAKVELRYEMIGGQIKSGDLIDERTFDTKISNIQILIGINF